MASHHGRGAGASSLCKHRLVACAKVWSHRIDKRGNVGGELVLFVLVELFASPLGIVLPPYGRFEHVHNKGSDGLWTCGLPTSWSSILKKYVSSPKFVGEFWLG